MSAEQEQQPASDAPAITPTEEMLATMRVRRKRNRVLAVVVHAVLFMTCTAGLAIATAILVDERPWALDLEATERMLGLRQGKRLLEQGKKLSKLLERAGAHQSFDEWIKTVGGVEHNERVQLLVKMLYMTCAGTCCLLCFCVLAISFFAPQNRPLVLTTQVAMCLGLSELGRYLAYFYEDSRHAPTCAFLLLVNWGALFAQCLDILLTSFHPRDPSATTRPSTDGANKDKAA
mmetsp:Transcript_63117/g.148683  ORF Transcript_63117/g.148683 Transcript_63117/m.148683 type:complete len:233 (+) Transcript_63117:282-980(+)